MSIELLILSFEKAEREIGSSKKTHLAQHLSDLLLENYRYPISERTLRDYYTNYKNGKIDLENALKPKLIGCLCNYLGYQDYADFVKHTQYETTQDPKEKKVDLEEIEREKKGKNLKWTIIISISIALIAILLFSLNEKFSNKPQLCMTWADSFYIKASCDKGPFSKYGTKIEPLKQMKFQNMRKVEVDAAYRFFSEDGKPLIWYSKNEDGEHEYFTAPGLHPTTGETLRKITDHIIEKYVPIHIARKDSFLK